MKHMKITTAELAKICRTTQGTVDRALNNRAGIKEETKRKILNAAKKYGYRNCVGSSCKDKISGQVGVIVFNLNNEYFSELVMEVENILKKIGFCTIVMMTNYDKRQEIECIRNMYNMGVKGIILCSVNSGDEFLQYLKMFDIPIVAVGNDIGGVPYVGIDDFAAMRDMTQKLKSEGYKKLIYFSPAIKYESAYAQKLRYKGFLCAAKGGDYEVIDDIGKIKTSYDNKSAVICSTDHYAFLVYAKAKNAKVVGFDNLKAIEKYNLNIDSVGYCVGEIARTAVDIIMLNKKEGKILEHKIESHSYN